MRTARFICGAIVTDIEGTVGPISFVRDVLFPYAQEHLAEFVAQHREDPEVAQALRDTAREAGEPDAREPRIVEILREWMTSDRKATPLKTLQGRIWTDGYERTGLRAEIYPDAAAGLRRWHAAGIELYVYSSGSVLAQKLYFSNTTEGDLLPLFRGLFDTTSGAKSDAASYRSIRDGVGKASADILYLSDREPEVDAAHAAGLEVATLLRPDDIAPGTTSKYRSFTSFDEIDVRLAGT
ncbi:MAG: acireductone synthase [Candidatus Velthaea sp.]